MNRSRSVDGRKVRRYEEDETIYGLCVNDGRLTFGPSADCTDDICAPISAKMLSARIGKYGKSVNFYLGKAIFRVDTEHGDGNTSPIR